MLKNKNNKTKIQYISVVGKIYKVTDIDFCNLTIEACETGYNVSDVPENEVFPIGEFEEFRIRLCNGGVTDVVVDIGEWMEKHGKMCKV